MQRDDQDAIAMEDSVDASAPRSGQGLHDAYVDYIRELTFGLIEMRNDSLWLGPLELIRFGPARISPRAVEWPIEGGLLARRPGGRLQIESSGGRMVLSVEGYHPAMPFLLYVVSQLPVHRTVTRLFLLRARGREHLAGIPASTANRRQAAAIDIALCAAVAALSGRRRSVGALAGIAVAYHLACWTVAGRTFGGAVMRQRVVAVDGSKPTFGQAVARLIGLPLAWVRRRPVHDEIAATEVIRD